MEIIHKALRSLYDLNYVHSWEKNSLGVGISNFFIMPRIFSFHVNGLVWYHYLQCSNSFSYELLITGLEPEDPGGHPVSSHTGLPMLECPPTHICQSAHLLSLLYTLYDEAILS